MGWDVGLRRAGGFDMLLAVVLRHNGVDSQSHETPVCFRNLAPNWHSADSLAWQFTVVEEMVRWSRMIVAQCCDSEDKFELLRIE
eukprot:767996-Hanusia_phi.AAC.2